MALLDSISEIRRHNGAVSATLELENIQSFLDDAINLFLVPIIGAELIAELIAAKPLESATVYQKQVIQFLQKSAISYAIATYSDNASVNIGNTGIGVTKSEKSAPASDKKLMVLKRSNMKAAFQYREIAVEYLEKNIDEFETYAESEEHKQNRSLLINNSREFQEAGVNIGFDAQLYFSLRTYVENATERNILPLVGEDYLETLQAAILNNSLSDFQKQLLKRIRKPLAAGALAEAIPYRVVSIDSNGIFELSETVGGISGNVENRSSATDRRLSQVMTALTLRTDEELVKLQKFIHANAGAIGVNPTVEININDGSAPNLYFL